MWFFLAWTNAFTGDYFVAKYRYDGFGEQAGYTKKGWKLRCIAAGKREGFIYEGMADESA